MKVLLSICLITFLASCATVNKNGYKQSRKYKVQKRGWRTHQVKNSSSEVKAKRDSSTNNYQTAQSDRVPFIFTLASSNKHPLATHAQVRDSHAQANGDTFPLTTLTVPVTSQPIPRYWRNLPKIHWLVYATLAASVLAPILFFIPAIGLAGWGLFLGVLAVLGSVAALYLMDKRKIRKNGKVLIYASLLIVSTFFSTALVIYSIYSLFMSFGV